jgi:hypothetical protein
MKNKFSKAPPPATAADLSQVGVDVMPSRYEIAKRAYFLQLNQAHPQRREVPVEWWETGVQIIECHHDVRGGVCGSPPTHRLLVFRKTP